MKIWARVAIKPLCIVSLGKTSPPWGGEPRCCPIAGREEDAKGTGVCVVTALTSPRHLLSSHPLPESCCGCSMTVDAGDAPQRCGCSMTVDAGDGLQRWGCLMTVDAGDALQRWGCSMTVDAGDAPQRARSLPAPRSRQPTQGGGCGLFGE